MEFPDDLDTYLTSMKEAGALLSIILALTQPHIFETAFQVIEALHLGTISTGNPEVVKKALANWSFPFTDLTILSNRESPLHRDRHRPFTAFDVMTTFGDYEHGRFIVPDLNRKFEFNGGSAMVGCTKLFEHGVARTAGQRIELVGGFRPSMLKRCSIFHESFLWSKDKYALHFKGTGQDHVILNAD